MIVDDLDNLVESLHSTIRENSIYVSKYETKTEEHYTLSSESTICKTGTSKPPKKPERGKVKKEGLPTDPGITKDVKRPVSLAEPEPDPPANQLNKLKVDMPVSLQTNLNELDTLLADLNSAKYRVEQDNRPPPPKSYLSTPKPNVATSSSQFLQPPSRSPIPPSQSPLPSIVTRKPRRPPKLMHVLKDGDKSRVHDLEKENRDEYSMDIEVPDEGDYGDYTSKWEYLGKGIWENQDYGSISNYSTLKTNTQREDYDYTNLSKSPLPMVSDEELEKETGAGPRGERSKIIPTDHGEVKSKYHYLGFGLWENTDPTPKPKPKKPSPPPPPPKAEPVWYNCTVAVTSTLSSKELDDLNMKDLFSNLPNRSVEVGEGVGDLGEGIGEPFEMFEKEDMSDMFRRAMFEKMNLVDDDNRKKYNCAVCSKLIQGRVITAKANKYHPECFVCTYCRKVLINIYIIQASRIQNFFVVKSRKLRTEFHEFHLLTNLIPL
ncbi:uncharacterized protein LOC111698800 isoform X2 [Eurytemora carolleeae]|uniref:uncharacterized protein LOC111698800 isoform X2 n=1 Tax=Eurytemora carolleeae TaxID=1294199 RepID=UPI000C790743|nr:uncharacterized protein LOC111698800 isoform X2 [Eurytemora carolleeae]|eukprot:XP_023325013.1 uncharacterized protein LOC111698800 isoform X2 [Eurytemora affinis]